MKHGSSAAAVQSWRALHANLLKLHSITGIFQRISPEVQNSDIEKCILMAAPDGEFILKHSCMAASPRQLQNVFVLEILTRILHFLLCVILKRNEFLGFFLGKGLGEKCKPTELPLNFVRKQYFS